jgi:GR25 family glycosyltransferase involved in LPS biosynthesis
MKIYVLHSSNLTKRKKHILEQFRIHNIYNFEFIEKYDITKITDDESIIFDKDYKRTRMSLFLKHLYVYELIAKDNDEEPTLIFEDDVILSDDFNEIVKAYIKETPEDYDMLFIGSGYNLHINKELLDAAAAHIYKNPYTRATDSYIITNKCAKKLCEYIAAATATATATATANNKITQPIDMWLNRAIIDNQLKIYWSEPTIVSQGSQTGLFELSL